MTTIPSIGYVDEPAPLAPRPGIRPFTATTQAFLDRLTELGLRPVHGDRWDYPNPRMEVRFGAGSGWLWGAVTISHTGRLVHLRTRWIDHDDVQYGSTTEGVAAIRAGLELHVAQRHDRIIALARRHGLTLTTP